MKYIYPAVFTEENNGGFSVVFEDLPSCYTCGDTVEETLEMAEDVLALTLYEYETDGRKIPAPSCITDFKCEGGSFVSLVHCDTIEYRKKFSKLTKNKPERYVYPAVFTYEDGCEIAVEFPDLEVATSGESENDALLSSRELLGIVLFGMEEDGDLIPTPSHLSDLTLKSNQKSVLVDVYMSAIRMANVNKSVNRTVTLPAWLNAAAQERGLNFSQVLQEALKQQIQNN